MIELRRFRVGVGRVTFTRLSGTCYFSQPAVSASSAVTPTHSLTKEAIEDRLPCAWKVWESSPHARLSVEGKEQIKYAGRKVLPTAHGITDFFSFYRRLFPDGEVGPTLHFSLPDMRTVQSMIRLVNALRDGSAGIHPLKEAVMFNALLITISQPDDLSFDRADRGDPASSEDEGALEVSHWRSEVSCFFNALSDAVYDASSSLHSVSHVEVLESSSLLVLGTTNAEGTSNRTDSGCSRRLTQEMRWTPEMIRGLASCIRRCSQLQSLVLRDLSLGSGGEVGPSCGTSVFNASQDCCETSAALHAVMDAIASHGSKTHKGETALQPRATGNKKVALRELHLSGLPSFLNSSHFYTYCLSKLVHLECFSMENTSIQMKKPIGTMKSCDNHHTRELGYWSDVLEALQQSIGGWYHLKKWSISNCGLSERRIAEALYHAFPTEWLSSGAGLSSTTPNNTISTNAASLEYWNISHNTWGGDDYEGKNEAAFFLSLCLRRCSSLQVFQARHCHFTGSNLQSIAWIAEGLASVAATLRSFCFASNSIGDAGFHTLIKIAIFGAHRSSTKAASEEAWSALEELDFSWCNLTTCSLVPLTECMWDTSRDAHGVAVDACFPSLVTLRLSMNDFRSGDSNNVDSCSLYVGNGSRSDDSPLQLFCYSQDFMSGDPHFRNRGDAKVLTSFELDRRDEKEKRSRNLINSECHLKQSSSETHSPWAGLKKILPSDVWSALGAALTRGCPSLRLLDLTDVRMDDKAFTAFLPSLRLPSLQQLYICGNPIFSNPHSSEKLHLFLMECGSSLETLDLRFTRFDDLSLCILCDGPSLSDESEGEEVMHEGVFSHGRMNSLKELRLCYTSVTDVGFEALVEVLITGRNSIDSIGDLAYKRCSKSQMNLPSLLFISCIGNKLTKSMKEKLVGCLGKGSVCIF